MIVAVDVDDTLGDFVSEWLRWYNLDFEENVKKSDITDWDISRFVTYRDNIYDYIKNPLIYNSVDPIPGALEGINKIREMGHRVIFVTSSPVGLQGRKFQWLNDWGFNVEWKDYVEIRDKSLISADLLIDDSPENVMNFKGYALLFDQPWNASCNYPFRAKDWNEVVKFVEEY